MRKDPGQAGCASSPDVPKTHVRKANVDEAETRACEQHAVLLGRGLAPSCGAPFHTPSLLQPPPQRTTAHKEPLSLL